MTRRTTTLLAVVLAGLVLVGCATDDGAVTEFEGLEGADLTIASKEFTEQLILGQMLVIALEEAGANVTDETSLAGTAVVREALTGGAIDAYWEYTGTAWADIHGQTEVVTDPDELLARVAELDEAAGVVWGARASFENSYGIAQSAEVADLYGVTTLSELAELAEQDPDAATLCVAEEFATRDDGLPGMTAHYDMTPTVPEPLDEGIIYTEVADGPDSTCNFGMVFTTDGRIAALDLVLLDDDESFFPEYHPAITVREEVAEATPELIDLANEIIATIGFEEMQELNARADVDGVPHEQVARDWLVEVGIIG